MAKKSYAQCIDDKDYETAIQNFENTSKRWKYYWWECLQKLYTICEDFSKKYILKSGEMIVEKINNAIKKTRVSKYDEMINDNGFEIKKQLGELCYLFEFYDENNNLICSKVGTTKRTIRQRLIEELRNKTYKAMGATKAIVNRVYECGDLPSEGLESLLRAEYIKQFPHSFKKNDRFIGEVFDFELCDRIAKNYLEMA